MARDIICDVDHVEIARWLVGDLRSGDQVGLCDEHLVAWGLAQIDTMLDEGQRLVAIAKLAEKLPEPPAEEPVSIAPGIVENPDGTLGSEPVEYGPPPEPKRGRRRPARNIPAHLVDDAIAQEIKTAEIETDHFTRSAPEEVAGEPPATPDG